jgi:hypothetical protein
MTTWECHSQAVEGTPLCVAMILALGTTHRGYKQLTTEQVSAEVNSLEWILREGTTNSLE